MLKEICSALIEADVWSPVATFVLVVVDFVHR